MALHFTLQLSSILGEGKQAPNHRSSATMLESCAEMCPNKILSIMGPSAHYAQVRLISYCVAMFLREKIFSFG